MRVPGEVDAFSGSTTDRHILHRIESNFRAREPAPYLTDEEGRWLLEQLSAAPRPQEVTADCPECGHEFVVDLDD